MSIIEGMCTEYQAGYTEYLENELKKTESLVRDLTALLKSVRAQCNTEREYAAAQQDRAIKAEEMAKATEADIETRANKAIWTLKEYCQSRECEGCFLWERCYGEEFNRHPRYWDPPWAKEN